MRLPRCSQLFALLCLSATVVTAIPTTATSWSEELLEEINSLRAQGLTEKEIASRYSRVAPPSRSRPVFQADSFPITSSSMFERPSYYIEIEKPRTKFQQWVDGICSRLGVKLRGFNNGDDEVEETLSGNAPQRAIEKATGGSLFTGSKNAFVVEMNEIPNEENWKYNGKGRVLGEEAMPL